MSAQRLHTAIRVLAVICGSSLIAHAQKPAVADVMKSAGVYLAQYAQKIGTLVAEEEYTQREPAAGNAASRRLTSDVVFTGLDKGQLATYRDVVSIDARDVRQRDGRLAALFKDGPTQAAQDQANAWSDEGLRYYLSPNLRTVDMPTLALEFLRTENQPQSEFSLDGGLRNQDGAQVATVRFKANKGAAILPTPEGSTTLGKAWIDLATGVIRQTELAVSGKRFMLTTTTKYTHDKGLDLWVPSEVSQQVDVTAAAAGLSNMGAGGMVGGRQSLEGRARSSKYKKVS